MWKHITREDDKSNHRTMDTGGSWNFHTPDESSLQVSWEKKQVFWKICTFAFLAKDDWEDWHHSLNRQEAGRTQRGTANRNVNVCIAASCYNWWWHRLLPQDKARWAVSPIIPPFAKISVKAKCLMETCRNGLNNHTHLCAKTQILMSKTKQGPHPKISPNNDTKFKIKSSSL